MTRKLTEGPIGPILLKLTAPMVLGIISVIAFNLIDTYFVGQLGTNQLAAMSFTFPVVMTFGSLAMGLGIGTSSVISRAIGKGNLKQVQQYTTASLSLSLVIVMLFVSLGFFTIEPLFQLLGSGPYVLPYIKDYMQIWYLGMLFLVIPMVGTNAIRAAGNTLSPTIIMAFAAALNIFLDRLFIFGEFGFPRLELQGAAIATVISRAFTLLAVLFVLRVKENLLSRKHPSLQKTIECWQEILKIGCPVAIAMLLTPFATGIITRLISSHGSAAVAGFGIATRTESFALITVSALAASIGPFVGQNWGANAFGRVRKALQYSYRFCLGWGLFVAVVLNFSGQTIATYFNQDLDVVGITATYYSLVPISYGMVGIILVASSAFNAMGKPLPAISISFLQFFIIYIPVAYIGNNMSGLTGIFAAAIISNFIVGILAYYLSQKNCLHLNENMPMSVKSEQEIYS